MGIGDGMTTIGAACCGGAGGGGRPPLPLGPKPSPRMVELGDKSPADGEDENSEPPDCARASPG